MDKFLEISKKLFQLAPWDYLGNEDYCQMFMEDEDPLLVCVTGSLVTQNFGFIICRNALQADYFLSLKENIDESEISSYRRYQHYAIYYKRYCELEPEERDLFKGFPGEAFYPVLRHMRWESHNAGLADAEKEVLLLILENLYQLIRAVAFGKIKKTNQEFMEVPTRIYNPKTKECDNLYFPFLEEMFRISPRSAIDQEKTGEAFQKLEGNGMVVEYDLLYLPLKHGDALLALGALWDVSGNRKLDARLLEIKGTREAAFMNLYLEYLLEYGVFREVRCRDNIDRKLLESLEIPKKPAYAVGVLENVDRVVGEIMDEYY